MYRFVDSIIHHNAHSKTVIFVIKTKLLYCCFRFLVEVEMAHNSGSTNKMEMNKQNRNQTIIHFFCHQFHLEKQSQWKCIIFVRVCVAERVMMNVQM